MTEEKKADVDAALAELEYQLWLAVKQGVIRESFQWAATLTAEGREPWIALLSVAEVPAKASP
jgi:hypothetical protein